MKKPALMLFLFIFFVFTACDRVIDPGDVEESGTPPTGSGTYAINVDIGDGLVTSESGTTATFTVVLSDAPTANVRIGPITSLNPAEVEVIVPAPADAYLYFSTADWSTAQAVIVVGQDDPAVDNTQTATIDLGTVTSTDTNYSSVVLPDLTVFNTDDDSPGSVVILGDPNGLVTNEGGLTFNIRMVLNRRPLDVVTLNGIDTTVPAEGSVTPSSLTFTPDNTPAGTGWNVIHSLTVSGVDDGSIGDGTVQFNINLGSTTSGDPTFDGISPPDLNGTGAGNEGNLTAYNMDYTGLAQYGLSGPNPIGVFPTISGTGIRINFNKCAEGEDEWDRGYFILPLPFYFFFLRGVYNYIIVYTDGYASFNNNLYLDDTVSAPHLSNDYDTDIGLYDNILAPWWCELDTGAVAPQGVYYEISGTSPNRIVAIEWSNVVNVATTDIFNFQIRLFESDYRIEFIYGNSTMTGSGILAQMGIRDRGDADALFLYPTDPNFIYIDTDGSYSGFIIGTGSDNAAYALSQDIADFPVFNSFTFTPPW